VTFGPSNACVLSAASRPAGPCGLAVHIQVFFQRLHKPVFGDHALFDARPGSLVAATSATEACFARISERMSEKGASGLTIT
jgi:hypothetical protein